MICYEIDTMLLFHKVDTLSCWNIMRLQWFSVFNAVPGS